MPRTLCRAAALAVAGLALLPLASAHAMHLSANDAVVLRYHFVAGQTYSYRLHLDMKMSMSGAGASLAGMAGGIAANGSGILHYHVLSVDASGGAMVRISTSKMTTTITANGKSSTDATAPKPMTLHFGADGSVAGSEASSFGSYGIQALGSLPTGAVAPGGHWSTASMSDLPSSLDSSLAPMHMTMDNVFVKYVQADGYRSADIHSTGTLQYVTDSSLGGAPVHMHLAASMAGQSLFGASIGRLVSSQVHMDMRMFMSGKDASSSAAAMREHIVMSVSMQPLGW